MCRIYYNICCSQTFSRSGTCPNGNGERVLWRQHTKRTIHVCNHTIRCDTTATHSAKWCPWLNMRWRIPHPHPLVAVAVPLCSHAMPLYGLQHHPDPHRPGTRNRVQPPLLLNRLTILLAMPVRVAANSAKRLCEMCALAVLKFTRGWLCLCAYWSAYCKYIPLAWMKLRNGHDDTNRFALTSSHRQR